MCCSVLRVRELVNRVAIVEAGRPARRVDGRPTRSAATAAAPDARTRSSAIAAHRGVARETQSTSALNPNLLKCFESARGQISEKLALHFRLCALLLVNSSEPTDSGLRVH